MNNRFLLKASCILLSTSVFAQEFDWNKSLKGTGEIGGNAIAVDSSGNIYTSGFFTETADLDPGPGTQNVTAKGDYGDAFISKMDSKGNLVWVKVYPQSDDPDDIQLIGDKGYIYATGGSFDGKMLISKLDLDGNELWVGKIGGPSQIGSASITVDSLSNIYITGQFRGKVDFDSGPGVFTLSPTGSSKANIYVLKLDVNGKFIWVKAFESESACHGISVKVDLNNNVCILGNIIGPVDFDPGPGVFKLSSNERQYDGFICKLDSNGKLIWAKNFGGKKIEFTRYLDLDSKGNLYCTGYFYDIADFDPGPGVYELTCSGRDDIFICKFNRNGELQWAKKVGGVGSDISWSVNVDQHDDVFLTGSFEVTSDFDSIPGAQSLTSFGKADIFILKLDSNGHFKCVKRIGGKGFDAAYDIKTDAKDNIYLTGIFQDTVDFNPGNGISNFINFGITNYYLLKLKYCQPYTTYDTISACDSYKWIDGKTYSASSDQITIKARDPECCEQTTHLNLTINNSYNKTIVQTACDSVVIYGKSYYESGTFLFMNQTAVGCDSNTTLNLIINNGSDTMIQKRACELFGFNDQVYTVSGKFYQKLRNSHGCDSLIEINLIIVNVDTNVSNLQNTLIALDSVATYQWLDCNDNFSIIPGAIQKTFTPFKDGSYAVILNSPPCIDTTTCIPVVLTRTVNVNLNNFLVYPNPTASNITIESNLELPYNIRIEYLSGSSLLEFKNVHTSKMVIPVENYNPGLYKISIQNSKQKISRKWLKI
ncbi:MAG: T9SS type A sorting domain-containing protein [Saprospiraceae bacterium]